MLIDYQIDYLMFIRSDGCQSAEHIILFELHRRPRSMLLAMLISSDAYQAGACYSFKVSTPPVTSEQPEIRSISRMREGINGI
jgi:hypothetical protein